MSEGNGGERRYVSNSELKAELDKVPTRWEVRFLILAAVIANQMLPTTSIAHAAIQAVMK